MNLTIQVGGTSGAFDAVLFAVVYGSRLLYQLFLLKHRDTSGTKGDWHELLLVVGPKNALVVFTVAWLWHGVARNEWYYVGWFVFLLGIIARFLALRDLGKMYSLNVDIRSEHRLVRHGMYSLVRHPLYVAYVLDTLGVLLFLQTWYVWLVLATVVIGWAVRIPQEERTLRRTFGTEYEVYSAEVPGVNLILGVWRRASRRHRSPASADLRSPRIFAIKKASLSDAEKSEIEIHLAEYNALSEFQRDAKATFVKIAIYHNTGILVVLTWLLQNSSKSDSVVSRLMSVGYFWPLLFFLPVLNSVLIIASAYQAYSFFCVALHFAHMRRRLIELVGGNVLAYEEKFERFVGRVRQLSLLLDLMAAVVWFTVPVMLVGAITGVGVTTSGALDSPLSRWAFGLGVVASMAAFFYLGGLLVLMRQVGRANPKGGAADGG
ncbi:MAG: isoprenylcysteine carboxylmethyltransferase family protein [Candidatus Solibacter usitatus]|nr:isoprenylcysteine carboxylmethyltransferase family protein [Candidatus Solibacter usitatus]